MRCRRASRRASFAGIGGTIGPAVDPAACRLVHAACADTALAASSPSRIERAMVKFRPSSPTPKIPGAASAPDARAGGVPNGYRQGLITAITVLLGFSLAFVRFWGFESPGHWTWRSLFIAVIAATAIVLELVALTRALRLEDDDVREYRTTVRWFVAAAVTLVLGLIVALVESAVA
jgi:hypothetical protein